MDGADDAREHATAAHIPLHHAGNLFVGWILMGPEQPDDRHHHAGCAVTALKCLGLEHGLLDWVQLVSGRNTFDSRDRFAGEAPDLRNTGSNCLILDEHGACATMTFAAAVLAAGQAEIIAKDREQTVVRIALDLMRSAVDAQREARHLTILPRAHLSSHHATCTWVCGPSTRPIRGRYGK